jgi:PST family polysaccharide transporter
MILAPLLVICLVFMPFVLKILYSDDFLGANLYISWACLGMALRFGSWIVSFLIVAKADSKVFIIIEFVTCIYSIILNLVGYNLWGMQGLGIAFVLTYILYFIHVFIVAKRRYEFSFNKEFKECFSIQLLLIIGCMVLVLLTDGIIKYSVGLLFIDVSGFLGLRGLNRRMDFVTALKKISRKNDD